MNKGNLLIGACCALFVAVIVTPTGVYEGVWKLATGEDAVDWIQAVGSILAIFISAAVAIGLLGWQRHMAIQDLKSAALSTCFELVRWMFASQAAQGEHYERSLASCIRALKLADDTLATIPIHTSGSRNMVSHIFALRNLASLILQQAVVVPKLEEEAFRGILQRVSVAAVDELECLAQLFSKTRRLNRQQLVATLSGPQRAF